MLTEDNLKTLKKQWIIKINNQSGIIYKYIQKELIESFLEDLRKINNL